MNSFVYSLILTALKPYSESENANVSLIAKPYPLLLINTHEVGAFFCSMQRDESKRIIAYKSLSACARVPSTFEDVDDGP